MQLYALYNAWGEGSADFSGIINMIRGKSEGARSQAPPLPMKLSICLPSPRFRVRKAQGRSRARFAAENHTIKMMLQTHIFQHARVQQ